ncbi:squalene synthase 1 [Selaginella moellendorffii]|uniref:squalene synthase 1 n=1 Tax=Selaginella moellendorffii TaxID=88036 RepID=UPI000D1CC4F1|nr:squalene synthase 1 [Selaginella moellendorffii]|eukprot:XP_024532546.1 squalene synthase 1 [Selaginella moellendorffii]
MGMVEALIRHPGELPALLQMKLAAARAAHAFPADPHMAYCYRILLLVSRSFAVVVQHLNQEIRDAVCIFYVVLRALDTVEDDMSIPVETKTTVLEEFYKHLEDPSWRFVCGEKHCRELMKNFNHLSLAFLQLSKEYQCVISDITKRMGYGMAEFIRKEVVTVSDYDKYCYYVAGLVGVGLSHLFNSSRLEDLDQRLIEPDNDQSLVPEYPAISMGRFLQKVNIIRDYLEDINELPAPRMFWPREIWGKYAPTSLLSDFRDESNEKEAVECLNDMITDCLRHAPECLFYMSKLKNPSVFRFCAVPQVMAIATAAVCYNNPQVFRGVVKIRRGTTAKIIVTTNNMADVCGAFYDFASILASKINKNDPSALIAAERVENIFKACRQYGLSSSRKNYTIETGAISAKRSFLVILVFVLVFLYVLVLLFFKV